MDSSIESEKRKNVSKQAGQRAQVVGGNKMKVKNILPSIFVAVICFYSIEHCSLLFAQADHYAAIQEIWKTEGLTSDEQKSKVKDYLKLLSFEEIVGVGNYVAEKHDGRCDAICLSEMYFMVGSYIREEKKDDYAMAVSEIKNRDRPSAWRWFWLANVTQMLNSSVDPEKLSDFSSVLSTVITDPQADPSPRINAARRLHGNDSRHLRVTSLASPETVETLARKDAAVAIMGDNIELLLGILKNPNENDQLLIRIKGVLIKYLRLEVTKQD